MLLLLCVFQHEAGATAVNSMLGDRLAKDPAVGQLMQSRQESQQTIK